MSYSVKVEDGMEVWEFCIKWTDPHGEEFVITTSDIDHAQTIIGLLSGEITEEDLKP